VETLLCDDVDLHSRNENGSIGRQFPFQMQGPIICCTVACAQVVECVRAYGKVCLLYRVMRHVAST
jgi:hypothetical protein